MAMIVSPTKAYFSDLVFQTSGHRRAFGIRDMSMLTVQVSLHWLWNGNFLQIIPFTSAHARRRYPDDYCAFIFPNPLNPVRNPQDLLANYLTHESPVSLVSHYRNSSAYALSKGKQLIMFETNTASCGEFPGISDAFVGALWSADYALQLAAWGFSGSLFHIGGQTAFYNVRYFT